MRRPTWCICWPLPALVGLNGASGEISTLLGAAPPKEAYVAPIESGGRVAALLYADNLPDDRPIGDTTALEIVLHEAGLAFDRALLEHALAERPTTGDHGRRTRRTLRVPTHLKVRATRCSTTEVSSSRNISEGGLFLVTRRPLAPGTPLHLEIEGRDGSAPIEVEGTVTWVRGSDDEQGPAGMGICFDHPDPEKQAAISALVERALTRAL